MQLSDKDKATIMSLAQDDIDACQQHLEWLLEHKEEEDRDQQIADMERRIGDDKRLLELVRNWKDWIMEVK